MTVTELYEQILSRFHALKGARELLEEPVTVTASKEPEETLRPENDPPSTVARPEYCVTAAIRGVKGEAYTEMPSDFQGTLAQALKIAPSEKGISAVTAAALNAAVSCLTETPGVFPADPQYHFRYADDLCRYMTEHYKGRKIVLVGYDGYIVKRFMEEGLNFWTLDMNPDHISQERFHHVIVNGAKRNRESSLAWGDIFLVTGSTLCNGTIIPYLDSGKELLFYGITCAAAAALLSLPWFAPEKP